MITLDQARTKPSLCQEYLDSLDLGDLRSRTRSIIYGDVPGTLYDADGEPDENGLAVTLYPHSGSEPGMKPCIRVFSKFFDGKCIKNVDDALSALGDHERAHVLQYEDKTQLDIKLMSYAVDRAEEYFRLNAMKRMATQNLYKEITFKTAQDIIEARSEIPAYQVQVDGFERRRVSEGFRKNAVINLFVRRELVTMIDDVTDGAASAMTPDNVVPCLRKIDAVQDMQGIMERYMDRMVEMTRGNGYNARRTVD